MGIPDLSIVMTSLNSAGWLRRSVPNVRETLGAVTAELILVDNGSTDESIAVALAAWPGATALPQGANLGWVKSNNVGMKHARGRYVMLLNNDVEIPAGYFEALVRFMDGHPDAGVCSGRILNPDGSDQGTARSFPSLANGIFGRRSLLSRLFPGNPWTRRFLSGRHQEGNEPYRVGILSGCCMMMPTALAREMQWLDESFDMYWGDAELCARIAARGRGVYVVPETHLLHHEGQGGSSGTWPLRLRSLLAFHRGAYLAYTKVHALAAWHPLRWLAALALTARGTALLVVQVLRPGKSTSSGGRN